MYISNTGIGEPAQFFSLTWIIYFRYFRALITDIFSYHSDNAETIYYVEAFLFHF